jgi:hypothetical protein
VLFSIARTTSSRISNRTVFPVSVTVTVSVSVRAAAMAVLKKARKKAVHSCSFFSFNRVKNQGTRKRLSPPDNGQNQ